MLKKAHVRISKLHYNGLCRLSLGKASIALIRLLAVSVDRSGNSLVLGWRRGHSRGLTEALQWATMTMSVCASNNRRFDANDTKSHTHDLVFIALQEEAFHLFFLSYSASSRLQLGII